MVLQQAINPAIYPLEPPALLQHPTTYLQLNEHPQHTHFYYVITIDIIQTHNTNTI